MGMFANLTQIFYNNSFCNGSAYFYKQSEIECFSDPTQCCDDIVGKQLIYNKCVNGTINHCSVPNVEEEDLGYILQLFGILFITIVGTTIIYGFCRFICYSEVENFDRDIERQKLLNERSSQGL
tara:strand:+ start:18684 stop:19055 length:372 start_codon:yes stop_codon:yes gene_type:complete